MTYTCIKGESAVNTQLFILPDNENLLTKVVEDFDSENRLVTTTPSFTTLTIRKHESRNKVVTAIHFDFKASHATNSALTAIKHRLEIHDINKTDKITFSHDWNDVEFAQYACNVFKVFKKNLILKESAKIVKSLVPSFIKTDEEAVKKLAEWTNNQVEDVEGVYEESHSDLVEEIVKSVTLDADHNVYSVEDIEEEVFNENERNTVVLRSPTGTRKTELAKKLIERESAKGRKTATLTGLIAVVKQHVPQGVSSAFYDQEMHAIENATHLSTTVNALYNTFTAETVKEADTIIIDECEKVLQSIFDPRSDYISDIAKRVIRTELAQIMTSNKKIILMDADATDSVTSKYAKSFGRAVKTVNMRKNVYKGIVATVESLEMKKLELIESKLLGATPMFIACDKKSEIDMLIELAGYTNKQGKADHKVALKARILVVHSGNKGQKAQKTFLENPNEEISKYRTVIVSPCLKEGFSIVANHADEVIVLCNRVLQPTALVQLARRLRTATRLTFAVPSFAKASAYSDFRTLASEGDITSELEAEFLIRDEQLKSNLRFTLTRTLQLLGFKAEYVQTDIEGVVDAVKKETLNKAEFAKSETEAIVEAYDLDDIAKAELEQKDELEVEDEFAIKKYDIAKRLRIGTERVDEDVVEFNKMFRKDMLKAFYSNIINDGIDSKESQAMKVLAEALGIKELSGSTEVVVEDTTVVYNHLVKKGNRVTFNAPDFISLKAGKKQNKAKGKIAATRKLNDIMKALGFVEYRNRKGNETKGKIYKLHTLAQASLFNK
ncbi:conserved hypothetical protein [Vibrio harveyi]|uniref:hypothetical protein n=1 Tax=Vibrio harveyi TaxID=669 RepID=UPI001EFD2623|nr:hypothetical protein [Vibrio harveyi]MCG9235125.1 hypothetical protein [Vibrio harveyi]MCG9587000.1 hypothetical protein [Vibrio harveyi]MCG9613270.1 hypothetical protein [Vibrio harveyi]MCG9667956.1 hypothetical protein [Vibrio harveyi]CAH1195928.1 conserved hypothetical protein [Vibrio harveyi]